MLSKKCVSRNETIIPHLMKMHVTTASDSENPIDLATAENWTTKKKVLEDISIHGSFTVGLSETDLGYSEGIGGSPATRSSIANLFNNHISPQSQVDPNEVVLAAGATYVLDALVEALCDPGDLIMIATPYWSGLDLSISIHNNATVLPVPVPLHKFFGPESIRYYEEAFEHATFPVKAVLLCNPHNPLGGCYSSELVKKMLEFCECRNIHMISDEVYALSIFGNPNESDPIFASVLSMPHDPKLVHVVYSLSKDFGCNGIRMGALISRNQALRMSVALSTHTQLSSLTAAFTANRILTPEFIDFVFKNGRIALREAYRSVVLFLEEKNIDFIPAKAGMFVFAKLCDNDEEDFQQRLQSAGVLIASGTSYHYSESGWFRICFGMESSILSEGLARLAKVLQVKGFGASDTLDSNTANRRKRKSMLKRRKEEAPAGKMKRIRRANVDEQAV